MSSHRILYVGSDHNLLEFLSKILEDCKVVRCPPSGSLARPLIESKINYSLFILDDKLPDTSGAELEKFARSHNHRRQTPIVIFKKSDDFNTLVETIVQVLAK